MPHKDPEQRKAWTDKWRTENKERIAAVRRAWYDNNQDKVKAGQKRNATKRKARMHERKPEINARRRQRYAEERDHRAKILARVRERAWDIPPEEFDAFMAMYDEECFYCGEAGGSIDHMIPRSRGGEDRLYNLVPSCKSCNSSKGTRTPEEWYNSHGFTLRRQEIAG